MAPLRKCHYSTDEEMTRGGKTDGESREESVCVDGRGFAMAGLSPGAVHGANYTVYYASGGYNNNTDRKQGESRHPPPLHTNGGGSLQRQRMTAR